jgi:hypothetical protein
MILKLESAQAWDLLNMEERFHIQNMFQETESVLFGSRLICFHLWRLEPESNDKGEADRLSLVLSQLLNAVNMPP